jgi:LysR family nitrogen assimilation transcriptional regulator
MLDIRSFRNFVKVVDLGSFSRAAEQVGLTQPALSQQVASLEAEFKVALLYRTPKGVTPTEAGKILHGRLQALLRQFEAARDDIAFNRQAPVGNCAIGLPNSVAEILSVPLIRAVQAKFPDIFVQVSAMPNRLVSELLASSRNDMALLFGEEFGRGIRSVAIGQETLFLLCATDSPFANSSDEITLGELAGRKFVLPCQPHHVRVLLDAYFLRNPGEISVIAEIDSLSNLIEMASSGDYESVLPWSAIHHAVSLGQIHARPLPQLAQRSLSICVSDQVALSEAGRVVLELLLQEVDSLVETGIWKGVQLIERDKAADMDYLLSGFRRL